MTKEQEFRKKTEEAKFEAFSLMCKKVADLEAKLKHAEENCINKTCVVFKDKEDCVDKLLELEKENKELKKENENLKNKLKKQMRCAGCIHSDNPCMPTDYEEDEDGFCVNYSSFFDEFEKLKEQIEKMKCYLPVDERDSDHKWFAYKNLFDTEWKIDYSVQGELPKCNTIKWFENKEAVMFYLVSNGMKYYEEPRR